MAKKIIMPQAIEDGALIPGDFIPYKGKPDFACLDGRELVGVIAVKN